jgi:hypothetical protein
MPVGVVFNNFVVHKKGDEMSLIAHPYWSSFGVNTAYWYRKYTVDENTLLGSIP